ncbi:alpha/beta-hydrolase [Zopfia rhizophila CBS 207.26]|uniref:Alpha/beta-hydrolase n=1 Tax=Zopfia rhizophila CBS 207.26 TaxID=1314779 RepID=A0A6A6D6P7_9PEZI|nr:alpha/beta-hydrolase [Zopfia rhizophila CBS 207.26]
MKHDAKEEDITITIWDGADIPAQVISPAQENGQGRAPPIVAMFHGGGYVGESYKDDAFLYRRLASELGAVVVSVGYWLAPEFPFATGILDEWDAIKWVYHNAATVGGDTSAIFIVGGVSAGGNLARVVRHLNRDEGNTIRITSQFLSVPTLCPPPVNRNLSPPSPAMLGIIMGGLKPDVNPPLFVPFNHPSGHGGLPPAYFQVSGVDGLRDEGLIYERTLREKHGITIKVDFYEGLPHAF